MGKKKVMIVDDEEYFLKTIKSIFEISGKFEVMDLLDAKDIISQVKIFKPDIILLDLLIAPIGGMEACEMLNDDPVTRTIPVVILSALDKDVDKLKAYKLGIVDYIEKPIKTEHLIAKIEKVLENRNF